MLQKNVPYVKNYENGILTNPILNKYNSGNSQRGFKRKRLRFAMNPLFGLIENVSEFITQKKTKRGTWVNIN